MSLQPGSGSIVGVTFYETASNMIVLGEMTLPIDCLPEKDSLISLSHAQLGAADGEAPNEIFEANIAAKVVEVSYDYTLDVATGTLTTAVDIYLELPVKDSDVLRWAASNCLFPDIRENKVNFAQLDFGPHAESARAQQN